MADHSPFAFHVPDAEAAVLLCHGFTGSPVSMRPWGEYLRDAGFTAVCPLLPGHGTHWRHMNRTRWSHWYSALAEAFDELRAQSTGPVFAMGMSMGGTLVTRLAEERGEEIAGLVLVNPSYLTLRKSAALAGVLKWVVPSLKGIADDIKKPGVTESAYPRVPVAAFDSLRDLWRITRSDLGKVTQPLLVFHSRDDHVVEPANTELLLRSVASTDVTDVQLSDSYHVATLDNEADAIFAGSLEFIQRLLDTTDQQLPDEETPQ